MNISNTFKNIGAWFTGVHKKIEADFTPANLQKIAKKIDAEAKLIESELGPALKILQFVSSIATSAITSGLITPGTIIGTLQVLPALQTAIGGLNAVVGSAPAQAVLSGAPAADPAVLASEIVTAATAIKTITAGTAKPVTATGAVAASA